jgi:hypothetical protein
MTLHVKVTIGGVPVLPYLQACLSTGSLGDVTTRQKSTSGVLCLTKHKECNAFDQDLFSVSCKKGQLSDASGLLTTLMQIDQVTFLLRQIHQVAVAIVLLPSSPEPSMHLDQPNQGRIKIEFPKRRS